MDARAPGGSRLRTQPAGSGGWGDASRNAPAESISTTGTRAVPPPPPSEPPPEPPSTAPLVPPGDPTVSELATGTLPKVPPAPKLVSLPPLDPTAHSSSAIPTSEARPKVKPPVLASECLREDIAPLQPHAKTIASIQAALGSAMIACAIAMLAGLVERPAHPLATVSGIVVAGAIVLAVPLLTTRYPMRGSLALAAAAAALAVALSGGLGYAVRTSHGVTALRLIAPVVLATALLLRSTYRASRTTRVGIALGVLFYAGAMAGALGLRDSSWVPTSVSFGLAFAMGLTALLSLLGFMGEETTGGCNLWGTCAVVLGALSFYLDLPAFHGLRTAGLAGASVVGLAMGVATAGLYQVCATALGPLARRKEDVRSTLPPTTWRSKPDTLPPPED